MTADTRHVIHPNPGGPTHAQSPYDRKLGRIREDLEALLIVAPEEDRSELLLAVGILDKLTEVKND